MGPLLLVTIFGEENVKSSSSGGVQQIHLAVGKDPTIMVVSWVTPNEGNGTPAPASMVRYGNSPDELIMESTTNNDAFTYSTRAGKSFQIAKNKKGKNVHC